MGKDRVNGKMKENDTMAIQIEMGSDNHLRYPQPIRISSHNQSILDLGDHSINQTNK